MYIPKFALLSYKTKNLGDEIQSIAAKQFLPSVNLLIDRDDWEPDIPDPKDEFKIILNGWFTHCVEKWPPPAFLSPLLISMHITQECLTETARIAPSVALMEGNSLDFFKKNAPVGARDLWTAELLKNHGIDSYFSGCVTLTLGANIPLPKRDYICSVDLGDELNNVLRAHTQSPILTLAHRNTNLNSFEERCKRANQLLSLYAQAKCVVTTRLHCALPCLALGTPVLLINIAQDQYRFSGLLGLMRSCNSIDFIKGLADFSLDAPTPNSLDYYPMRESLIERLESFTGAPMTPFLPIPLNDIDRVCELLQFE